MHHSCSIDSPIACRIYHVMSYSCRAPCRSPCRVPVATAVAILVMMFVAFLSCCCRISWRVYVAEFVAVHVARHVKVLSRQPSPCLQSHFRRVLSQLSLLLARPIGSICRHLVVPRRTSCCFVSRQACRALVAIFTG